MGCKRIEEILYGILKGKNLEDLMNEFKDTDYI